MTKKERLQKLIGEGNEFVNKGLTNDDPKFNAWNASVIRFVEKEFGVNSTDSKRFKERTYAPHVVALGGDTTELFIRCFENDIETSIAELKSLMDDLDEKNTIEENRIQKRQSPTFNFNIDNSNTNTNNVQIDFSLEEIHKRIDENTMISDSEKEELFEKIEEIKKIQSSNESRNNKWKAAKKILAFVIDKGVDIAIMFIPQILKAIS